MPLTSSTKKGRTAAQIQAAIGSVGAMSGLSSLTSAQVQAIHEEPGQPQRHQGPQGRAEPGLLHGASALGVAVTTGGAPALRRIRRRTIGPTLQPATSMAPVMEKTQKRTRTEPLRFWPRYE